MRAKFEKDKTFKNELVKHFDRNRKTSYGKNQVVVIIKDLWIKHLESFVEDQLSMKIKSSSSKDIGEFLHTSEGRQMVQQVARRKEEVK